MTPQELIKELKGMGFTKWEISKRLHTSWNAIRMWERGMYKPNKSNYEKLEQLFHESKYS